MSQSLGETDWRKGPQKEIGPFAMTADYWSNAWSLTTEEAGTLDEDWSRADSRSEDRSSTTAEVAGITTPIRPSLPPSTIRENPRCG